MRPTAVLLALILGLAVAPLAQAKDRASHARGHGPVLVAAANPLAAKAGMDVLKRGGSAVDAAVAIQAVLGLVEPQSSGVGGGAFMTFYDARTHTVTAYNGREIAPAGATPDMFLGPDGKPMPFREALVSGRATGVPGAYTLLALAHKDHGKLAWSSLFADGERLGDQGFVVSPRLAHFLPLRFPQNARPDVIAYFHKPSGELYQAGDVLRNPAYAATLRALAARGPDALYEGPIAEAILAKTHEGPLAGTLTAADLKAYRAKEGPALCRPYRIYIVCVPRPPSSGVGVLEALALLEHTDIDKRGPTDPKAWLQIEQAEELMYADRDRYVGDPDFVSVPVEGMLDPAYVASRAKLMGPRAFPPPPPGTPPGAGVRAPDHTVEPGGTSHMVIVDADGNAVSMTTTVESIFGTGRMVGGFFLNNQLTDFSFAPKEADGAPAANAVGPRKRPRSSMVPVIVLDRQGRLYAALGSPGGNAILGYDIKTLVAVLDWKMSMQDAAALPNLVARGPMVSSEADKFAPGVADGLRALGVDIKPGQNEESGIHGVIVRPGGKLEGGADPRREGVVLTD
jgi:gamma-glutamyltranspeptidase/glutathione hydrolase